MSVESMNASAANSVQAQMANQKPEMNQVQNAIQNTSAAQESEKVEMSTEEVQAVVDKLNEFMETGQRNLNFSVDKDTDNVVVKVMDKTTSEVIRQFPSEETLKLAKHIEGMLGLIFNDKA